MKRVLIIATMMLLLISSHSFGQDIKLPHFYVHTGITKPASPKEFLKSWTMGANVGLGLSLDLSERIELITLFDYHHLTLNKRGVEDLYNASSLAAIEGGPASITNFQVKANFNFPHDSTANMISYFYTGAGYNHLHQQDIAIYEEEDETLIGSRSSDMPAIEFGIGFHYMMESTSLFVEFGANIGFDEPDILVFVPIRLGVKIN
ncbi:hypothetical protein JXB12_09060 [candidate division KSB1 bacterium]|nr:hypothetical protein [candidate division KSB1 bacterium]